MTERLWDASNIEKVESTFPSGWRTWRRTGSAPRVIYPQAVFKQFSSPDPGYQKALANLYNDWHHEIFGGHPDRFVVSAQIPIVDINDGIAEAQRTAKMGYRSMSLPVTMPARSYNSPEYEPFWDTVEELGVPLAFHVFTSGPAATPPSDEPYEDQFPNDLEGQVVGMTEAMYPMVQLIGSGALQRHPGLKSCWWNRASAGSLGC